MNLWGRVKRLFDDSPLRAERERERRDAVLAAEREREYAEAFDRRFAVLLRFVEAVPESRGDAVQSLLVEHKGGILEPEIDYRDDGAKRRPALVRAVAAFASTSAHRTSWFPDPLPEAWLDLYLENPAAEAAACDCEDCSLIHPSLSDYRPTPGEYWQNWVLSPGQRCVVCGGHVSCNGYWHKRQAPHMPATLGELLLSDGGRLEFDTEAGERLARLVRPAVDPIARFHPPTT